MTNWQFFPNNGKSAGEVENREHMDTLIKNPTQQTIIRLPRQTGAGTYKIVRGADWVVWHWPADIKPETETEREFRLLAAMWQEGTGHLSTMTDILMHPAHLRIIGMGQRALPLILDELRKRQGHWFTALAAISGESVASDDMSYDQAIRAWLEWGRAKGFR